MGPWTKFDDSQQLRSEIEERTRNGETCAQIADALVAKGFNVSNKTISRRRVEWGLRKRASPKTKGTVRAPRPRPDNAAPPSARTLQKKGGSLHKAEIAERTQRGESAQEICDALVAKGVEIKKGASSILRLQTYWGIIPYDPDRAFGRGKYRKKKPPTGRPRGRPRISTRAVAPAATGPQDYPPNCRFGPCDDSDEQQESNAEHLDLDMGGIEPPSHTGSPGQDDDFSDGRGMDVFQTSFPSGGRSPFSVNTDAVALATDMVTAQMLIDASATTTAAATHLKAVLHRIQSSTNPPSQALLDAVVSAKKKVLDAARTVADLTAGPFPEPGMPG